MLVPAADWRARWEWVRAGLLQAQAKSGERYTPEDLWLQLREGRAFLFLVQGERPEPIGFAIFKLEQDPDGPALFVWALWLERGTGKQHLEALWSAVDSLKVACKAKRVRWHGRKGWARFARVVSHVYERE